MDNLNVLEETQFRGQVHALPLIVLTTWPSQLSIRVLICKVEEQGPFSVYLTR